MTTDHNSLCPRCGSKLESFDENGLMGARCTNCDWMVVATSPHSVNLDDTIYTFEIYDNAVDSANIRSIAHIRNINFLEAKKFLERQPIVEIIKGVARDIDSQVLVLRKSQLKYRENPKYPYS